ncbi:hypothetical protein HDE_01813 [Halotydeus destructor]|nr:hypothetical protein HDE_01813 [Halotydeus destructor]
MVSLQVLSKNVYVNHCGIPPRPYLTESNSTDQNREEGTVISYTCPGNDLRQSVLVCEKSRWMGVVLQCGIPRKIAITKLSANGHGRYIDKTYDPLHPRFDSFTIRDPMMDSDGHPGSGNYHWTISLDRAIEIAFIDMRLVIPEHTENQITVNNVRFAWFRECVQSELVAQDGKTNGSNVYHFQCYQNTGAPRILEHVISFDTMFSSNQSVSAIILKDVRIASHPFYCGLPEIPPHLITHELGSVFEAGQKYRFACKSTASLQPDIALCCSINGEWVGSYPTCTISDACGELNLTAHETKYSGAFYDNKTFLVEDTKVEVTCNPFDVPFAATCTAYGWQPDILCLKSMSSILAAAVLLSGAIAALVILAVAGVLYIKKKLDDLKRRQAHLDDLVPRVYEDVVYGDFDDDPKYLELYAYPVIMDTSSNTRRSVKAQQQYDDTTDEDGNYEYVIHSDAGFHQPMFQSDVV